MGGVGDFFFGSGSKVANPFSKEDRDFGNFIRDQIKGIGGDVPGIGEAFDASSLEKSLFGQIQNMQPGSFFAGPSGSLNIPNKNIPIRSMGSLNMPGRPTGGGGETSGLNVLSLLSGGKNYLDQAGGFFGRGAEQVERGAETTGKGINFLEQGAGALSGDTTGAEDLLRKTIAGSFTDVANNPIYQARNKSISDEVQRFLNQNIDVVGGSSQRASGGVGAGSAGSEAIRRLVTESGNQLGSVLANLTAQDLSQERGFQTDALTKGLQLPFEKASAFSNLAGQYGGLGQQFANLGETFGSFGQGVGNVGQGYGNLASIFGQARTAAGGLDLDKLKLLSSLATGFAERGQKASTLPFDLALSYLASARGVGLGASPSGLGQLLQGAGGLGQGIGAIMGAPAAAASDERLKKGIHPIKEELEQFLDEIKSYGYEYKEDLYPTENKKHVGVMAQDLEKTSIGKSMVIDTPKGKYIHMGLGFGVVLAAIKNMHDRIKALENAHRI